MICLVGVEGEGTVCEACLRLLLFSLLDLDIMAVFPGFVAGVVAGKGGTGQVGTAGKHFFTARAIVHRISHYKRKDLKREALLLLATTAVAATVQRASY